MPRHFDEMTAAGIAPNPLSYFCANHGAQAGRKARLGDRSHALVDKQFRVREGDIRGNSRGCG